MSALQAFSTDVSLMWERKEPKSLDVTTGHTQTTPSCHCLNYLTLCTCVARIDLSKAFSRGKIGKNHNAKGFKNHFYTCIYMYKAVYLLSQFLYLVDDLSGNSLVHHLLGGGHVKENKEATVSVGVVLQREGGVNSVRNLEREMYNVDINY